MPDGGCCFRSGISLGSWHVSLSLSLPTPTSQLSPTNAPTGWPVQQRTQPSVALHSLLRILLDIRSIILSTSDVHGWLSTTAMVLLAASICTRGGKPVISRQFKEMSRSRVEGLLASFPKLVSSGSQHTTIETEHVRYVYQPLEDLYMILITNKNSNILQDIDTLHLFARVVSDLCRSLDERDILRNSFELLGAFDEIISLGYRENVNLAQVRTILEMDSHEEKIQEIIERNKELEAKEELKRRAKQLEMQRRDAARRGGVGGMGGVGGGAAGYGAGAGGYSSVSRYDSPSNAHSAPVVRDTGAE